MSDSPAPLFAKDYVTSTQVASLGDIGITVRDYGDTFDYGDTLLNPQICKLPNFSKRKHVMGQQNPSAKTRLALIMATRLRRLR